MVHYRFIGISLYGIFEFTPLAVLFTVALLSPFFCRCRPCPEPCDIRLLSETLKVPLICLARTLLSPVNFAFMPSARIFGIAETIRFSALPANAIWALCCVGAFNGPTQIAEKPTKYLLFSTNYAAIFTWPKVCKYFRYSLTGHVYCLHRAIKAAHDVTWPG